MRAALTSARNHKGDLIVRINGVEDGELACRFEEVLATRTPNSRPNYLRLALRYSNARVAAGAAPHTLFKHGTAYFRSAVSRWHKNNFGRFAWEWDGDRIIVFIDDQEDEDVTEALNHVLGSHFKSSRRKYLPFLISFINFEAEADEAAHAFVTEVADRVNYRVEKWMEEELDLVIDVRNGQPDSSVDVRSKDGPIDHKALGIAAIRQLYEVLRNRCRLRTGPNPLDIDGLEDMGFLEKMDLARTKYGLIKRLPKYFGAQYAIKGRSFYAPVPHDPLTTYVVLKKAADELGTFPPVLYSVLGLMDTQGPRHHDIRKKCMDAWSVSGFGDWMWADNKNSLDPEYKKLVFGPEVMAQMRCRVDKAHFASKARPMSLDELVERVQLGEYPRPSIAQLEALRAAGRTDILARIPLFPANHGRPYSYSGWNKWIRKATETANDGQGAFIATSIGDVRPTAVWLRRSHLTERVKDAVVKAKDAKDLKSRIDVIRDDVGHRSEDAIYRYIGSIAPDLFDKLRHERAAEDRARVQALRDNIPLPNPAPVTITPLSAKSQRLRARARA